MAGYRGRDLEGCHLLDSSVVLAGGAYNLAAQFAGVFCLPTVRRCLAESYDLLAATARVHTHLPVLATALPATGSPPPLSPEEPS